MTTTISPSLIKTSLEQKMDRGCYLLLTVVRFRNTYMWFKRRGSPARCRSFRVTRALIWSGIMVVISGGLSFDVSSYKPSNKSKVIILLLFLHAWLHNIPILCIIWTSKVASNSLKLDIKLRPRSCENNSRNLSKVQVSYAVINFSFKRFDEHNSLHAIKCSICGVVIFVF